MGYPERLIAEGESVVFDGRPHAGRLFGPSTLAIVTTGGGAFVLIHWPKLFGPARIALVAVVGLSLLRLAFRILSWHVTRLVVTNKRLVERVGFVRRTSRDVALRRITAVTVHQGIVQRLIKRGSIEIELGAEAVPVLLREVRPNPARTARLISGAVDEVLFPAPSLPDGERVDPSDRLERLEALHRRGVITSDELVEQRAVLAEVRAVHRR